MRVYVLSLKISLEKSLTDERFIVANISSILDLIHIKMNTTDWHLCRMVSNIGFNFSFLRLNEIDEWRIYCRLDISSREPMVIWLVAYLTFYSYRSRREHIIRNMHITLSCSSIWEFVDPVSTFLKIHMHAPNGKTW